ncbi:hypothetical protein [Nonomuraea candida]|uniref:hypothetical protein n=1 Tax=Nonomuraea candida TaxID=359159 RepID=UPI0005BDBA3D|nr:hypothetical protein [Nonomuraea candida]
MTITIPEQTAPAAEQAAPAALVAGYVVVDANQIGDSSGWMTPRMRATREQAEEDRDYWRDTSRTEDMELRITALVLLDEPKPTIT